MSGILRTMRRRMVRDMYGAGALPSKKFGRQGRLFRPDGSRHIRAEKPVLNTPPALEKTGGSTYYEALVKLSQRLTKSVAVTVATEDKASE